MYLVAHQDDCQMVTGNTHQGTYLVNMPVPGEHDVVQTIEVASGSIQRVCNCEPLLVRLERRDGDDAKPHWRVPRFIT